MNVLTEAADTLRKLADRLDAESPELNLPESKYTLKAAMEKLLCALPGYWNLSFELSHTSTGIVIAKWRIYDGSNSHEASTISGAVNACLAAHATPSPLDPIDEVQTVFDEATAIAL
jgi:hypothetical protein